MENALVDLIDVLLVVAIGFGIIMIVLPPHTAASGCGNKKPTFLRGLKGTKRANWGALILVQLASAEGLVTRLAMSWFW
jgi:hypothetical protein